MKTENIISCINICKNNPDYRLDGYLAENELQNLIEKPNKKISFVSTGVVIGDLWSGSTGIYTAQTFKSEISIEDLIEQNQTALNVNKLCVSGEFSHCFGALLYIDIITEIEIEGKIFVNVETIDHILGDLSKQQIDFLYTSVD